MESTRLKKIENRAQRIVGDYFAHELRNDEQSKFRLISIVNVKLASDLSYFDIFVSSMAHIEELPKALAPYAREIESRIYKELELRKKPRLRFKIDDSWEKASHIIETINSLS